MYFFPFFLKGEFYIWSGSDRTYLRFLLKADDLVRTYFNDNFSLWRSVAMKNMSSPTWKIISRAFRISKQIFHTYYRSDSTTRNVNITFDQKIVFSTYFRVISTTSGDRKWVFIFLDHRYKLYGAFAKDCMSIFNFFLDIQPVLDRFLPIFVN